MRGAPPATLFTALLLAASAVRAQHDGADDGRPPPDFGPPPWEQHGRPMPPEQAQAEAVLAQVEAAAPQVAMMTGRVSSLAERYRDPGDVEALLRERSDVRARAAEALATLEAAQAGFKEAYRLMLEQGRMHDPYIAKVGEAGGPFPTLRRRAESAFAPAARLKAALDADEKAFLAAKPRARRGGPLKPLLLLLFVGGAIALAVRAQRNAIASAVREATRTALAEARTPPPPAAAQPATPPAAPVQGTVLGDNFRVERQLGAGGMGVVYLATDMTLKRQVAIKRMRDELLQGGSDYEAFLNEARLVAALKHPNIVEIHSIVKEQGVLYLVFEYVDGRSLRDWIGLQSRLPLPGVKSVLYQVCQALDYAHAQKIVHRDLKPANVMVDARGAAKVMDFGIAHQAQVTLARTTRGGLSGTPAYMAPEQEMGSASRASDVYAAGVCLYEMLTGRLPYTGPNFLAQKMEMRFPPPSALVPGLPPAVDTVTLRAMAPDPGRRFATAGELGQAFAAV